ncbi:MAG TPA: T9SS type A sorting domain-containing protein [Candidatus Cloacimonetes bacterium]|nr:T9SS type A sorting domain-containing protein [Candidatus Cloacimonadota bacterium]
MFKLLLSLMITLFINLFLFADGVQPAGSGTDEDPYQVSILDNLLWISTNPDSWSCHFIQTADIDASETVDWNDGEGFSSIGSLYITPFMGNYNGHNNTISGIYCNRDTLTSGFFGFTSNAFIENLNIINASINGNGNCGVLIGWSGGSVIQNCFSTGNVTGSTWIGGLIGDNSHTDIINCESNCSVTGNTLVGGLTGWNYNNSSIINCHSNSNVTGYQYVGGMTGRNLIGSTLQNCFSTGEINGNSDVGGLVGLNDYDSEIGLCFSNCEIYGTYQRIGGLVGYNNSVINNCYSRSNVSGSGFIGGLVGKSFGEITNCYSTGYMDGEYQVGGLISLGSALNSFWDMETSGQTTSDGGTGKTTAEMTNVATYTDLSTIGLDTPWDFVDDPYDDTGIEDIWAINTEINDGYPYLADIIVGTDDHEIEETTSGSIIKNIYPNPFSQQTTIKFNIKETETAVLSIYNIKGQRLLSNNFQAGTHEYLWNAINYASGIYFVKLQTRNYFKTGKMLLVK